MAADRLIIGGHRIRPGTTEQILLKVSEFYTATPVNVPVTVIRGIDSGETLFLTVRSKGISILNPKRLLNSCRRESPSAVPSAA